MLLETEAAQAFQESTAIKVNISSCEMNHLSYPNTTLFPGEMGPAGSPGTPGLAGIPGNPGAKGEQGNIQSVTITSTNWSYQLCRSIHQR